jgi:uncharacterized protein YaiE (UPF0345 family)
MAAESIGSLVPTKIPGLSDQADIQAALRVYHYGSYTFDTAETDPAELINPSIAYTINDIQDQIDAISGGSAIQATSFNAKGDLLSASANDTLSVLSVGSNGKVLTANSATATGLEWTTIDLSTTLKQTDFNAKGDILAASANDTLSVLTVGANERRLVADSTETAGLKYVADTTNYAIAAKGDLLVGTAADTVAPLTVGTNGQILIADSTAATGLKWGADTGKVVQIVRGSTSNIVTANIGASTVETGLSATITPTSASNKIVIFVNQNGLRKLSGPADFSLLFQMFRGTTNVGYFGGSTLWTGDTSASSGDVSGVFFDTPGTTSPITYSTKVGRAISSSNSVDQTGFIYMNFITGESTILLMEVTP